MDILEQVLNMNWVGWVLGLFLLLSAIVFVGNIISKFADMIGKPIGALRQRKLDHEMILANTEAIKALSEKHQKDTEQSIRHDKMIRDDLAKLSDTVNKIAISFEDMKNKNNETKLKELKDTLICYYNKYRVIGEWSKLEKDAFWDLFEEYEKRGGNGYIHSIVEPVMRELKETN